MWIIEFSGKKSDWDGWCEKFLAWTKQRGHKKLLAGKGDQIVFNKIPTQEEYDSAVARNSEPL